MEPATLQLDRIEQDRLQDLLTERDGPCLSLYMPTHRIWSEVRHDVIRLKNLLGQAKDRLVAGGMRPADAAKMLQPACRLEDDESFWRERSDGLALFLSPDDFFRYQLPLDFDELVVAADRFHIKPLLKLVTEERRFHVLALNLEHVRLFTGTRYQLTEQPLEDVPVRLSEALRLYEFERQHQLHTGTAPTTGGPQGAVFHGHGAAADDANVKKQIVEFFRRVDNGVRNVLADEQGPLILAGQDHLRGLYRMANHYEYLIDESIDGNPDNLGLNELHEKAWGVVAPHFRKKREDAAAAFQQLLNQNSERASDRLEDIVPAAYFRRVKVLFVREGCHEWGWFDPDSQEMETHAEPRAGDHDLLDFAVAQTIRYAGTVYLEDEETMPANGEAAAVFRY